MIKKPLFSEKLLASIQVASETVLIIAGLLALLVMQPREMTFDGLVRFQQLSELLEYGTLSPVKYSIIGPLFATPFWLLGKLFSSPTAWCEQYNLFIFVLGMLLAYFLLRNRVERGLLRKFFLMLIAGSLVVPHVTNFYGEMFTATGVGIGLLAIFVRFSSLAGWVAIILGVANTPASLLGLGLVVLKHTLESRRLRYLLVLVIAAGLIGVESWIRRGSPFVSGYEHDSGPPTLMPYSGRPGFSYPFFFGLLSILFSFGKGLVFFAPGLLLPIRSTLLKFHQEAKFALYRVYVLWICFLIGLILVYARWWAWYGALWWGPRFFLFAAIPASFALAVRLQYDENASLLTNLFTLLVLALSLWISTSAAVFGQVSTAIPICYRNHAALEVLCIDTPEFSALWYPFVVHLHLSNHQFVYLLYYAITFLYLAIPLAITITNQTWKLAGSYWSTHCGLNRWHF